MVIALTASTLHRARERTLDEETLEEEGDKHGGKNGQYACREHRAVFIELRLAKEAGDHDRDRLGLRRRGEDQREQELVPAREKAEDDRGHDARAHDRDEHARHHTKPRASVDQRRTVEAHWHALEIAAHHPRAERQQEGRVSDDEASAGVDQRKRAVADEERQHERERWSHAGQQEGPKACAKKSGFAKTSECVSGESAERNADQRNAGAYDEAVEY